MRFIVFCFCLLATPLHAFCRQALVLALDVSGSVDGLEYRQQLDGLADALEDPEVMDIILAMPSAPVALSAFEWSHASHQVVLHPWVTLDAPLAIRDFADVLRQTENRRENAKTAIGSALQFASGMLEAGPDCWRQTIDLSGDGQNNDGPLPQNVRVRPGFDGITINGLGISGLQSGTSAATPAFQHQQLLRYYTANVAHGPGSFVIMARGYRDYARAMREKLIRELGGAVIGDKSTRPSLPRVQ